MQHWYENAKNINTYISFFKLSIFWYFNMQNIVLSDKGDTLV